MIKPAFYTIVLKFTKSTKLDVIQVKETYGFWDGSHKLNIYSNHSFISAN